MASRRSVCGSLLLGVVIALVALPAAAAAPTSGLVGYWPFTGNADDASGNGLHGTPVGAALAPDSVGETDAAYSFDGLNDLIDLGSSPQLRPPLPVTVAAWVRHECTNPEYCGVFANDTAVIGANLGVGLAVVPVAANDYRVTIGYGDGSPSATTLPRSKTGTTNLAPGVWYHIAGVIRGPSDMDLYVNGVDDSGTYSGSGGALAYFGGNANIGRVLANAYLYHDGVIDEVYFYDRSLSAAEVGETYLAGLVDVAIELVNADFGHQFDASISDGYVSYTSDTSGTEDVFVLTPVGGVLLVSGGPGTQQQSDASATRILYTDDATGSPDLFIFDAVSQITSLVAASPAGEFDGAISNGNVVYLEAQGGTDILLWFDDLSGSLFQLDPIGSFPFEPALDGNVAAWSAFDGTSNNIYATVLGGASFPVAVSPGQESSPSVSGDRIAYAIDGDVHVRDVVLSQTTVVTNDAFTQSSPQLSGDFVYYNDDRNGNLDILIHDLATGKKHRLTNTPDNEFLTDADGDQAVYHAEFNGDFDVFRITWLPEPGSLPMLLSGVAFLVTIGRRRIQAARVLPAEQSRAAIRWAGGCNCSESFRLPAVTLRRLSIPFG